MTTVYVGNLPPGTTPADLWALFGPFGRVAWAAVRPARLAAGAPTGVVDMGNGGTAAVAALYGSDYRGRTLAVGAADPPAGGGSDWVV